MIRNKFAIYDSKADCYLDDFTSPTIASALRSFTEAANTEGNQFNKHAGDFTLFHIGTFDPDLGLIVPLEKGNINLGTALSVLHEPDTPRLREA